MTSQSMASALAAAGIGSLVAFAALYLWASRVPSRLLRTNVNGREVPALLGPPLLLGGLPGLAWAAFGPDGWTADPAPGLVAATAAVALVLGAAGMWDDLRGDELPRGFGGHLAAIRTGRLTGGLVKLFAGGAVGLLAGALTTEGSDVLAAGMLVALSANLLNLLDRAPGRAGKFALALGVASMVLGGPGWGVLSAGFFGGLAVVLPLDLRERAMLGDCGANALGGVLGLGLAVTLPSWGRWVAVALLLALNVASERVSFSRVIAGNAWLRRLDMLGRQDDQNANTSDA